MSDLVEMIVLDKAKFDKLLSYLTQENPYSRPSATSVCTAGRLWIGDRISVSK